MPTQAAIDISLPALPTPSLPKADREVLAFRRLLPQLHSQYSGEFVAIHDEQVIDHDQSDVDLIQRVHARIGYVPIHVGLVTHEPPISRIPHYREFRGAAAK
jgi:hypothetical protein